MELDNVRIKDVYNCTIINHTAGMSCKISNRKNHGLSISCGGKITYFHNNKKIISDENHVIFHPKNSTYELKCTHSGKFYVIDFDCYNEFTEFSAFFVESITPIIDLLEEIMRRKSSNIFALKNISILYSILYKIQQKKPSNPIVNSVINMIEEKFTANDLTVSDISKKHNISECYLRRLFIQSIGQSPKQFLIQTRINHSKQLLLENLYSVNEVAEKSGFTSVYHFCRTFKSTVGMSPKKFSANSPLNM